MYVIVNHDGYGICFVPKQDFDKIFVIYDRYKVTVKEDIEWEYMSGGFDTYLQCCSIKNGRSDYHYGTLDSPLTIIAVYCYVYLTLPYDGGAI
jgi:hypothetical protein